MKSKTNPAAIGMFITGAVVILFVSVALFGSGRMFRQTRSYLLTFREAVTGLNVGAPVKMLGVNIGEVKEIILGVHPTDGSPLINVVVAVDSGRWARDGQGMALPLEDRDRFEKAVKEHGLHGRLEILSLLSSQLYIGISQDRTERGYQLGQESEHGYWEIPTLPSAQAEIMASVMSTLEGLAHFDLKTISQQTTNLLADLRADLAAIEFPKVNAKLLGGLDKLDALLGDPNLRAALTNLHHTLADARQLAGKLNRETDPLLAKLATDLDKIDHALTQTAGAFTDLKSLVRPGSPVSTELLSTLEKAGRALESFRELAEDLRRNPSSILTGKASETP